VRAARDASRAEFAHEKKQLNEFNSKNGQNPAGNERRRNITGRARKLGGKCPAYPSELLARITGTHNVGKNLPIIEKKKAGERPPTRKTTESKIAKNLKYLENKCSLAAKMPPPAYYKEQKRGQQQKE